MRQFFLLLVVVATLSFLPGCGGGPAAKSSPDEQKQRLAETDASMKKGMEAMKSLEKGPAAPAK